jgi:hypothetical protein
MIKSINNMVLSRKPIYYAVLLICILLAASVSSFAKAPVSSDYHKELASEVITDNFPSNDRNTDIQEQHNDWKLKSANRNKGRKPLFIQRKRGVTGFLDRENFIIGTVDFTSHYQLCLRSYRLYQKSFDRPGYYIHLFRYALF